VSVALEGEGDLGFECRDQLSTTRKTEMLTRAVEESRRGGKAGQEAATASAGRARSWLARGREERQGREADEVLAIDDDVRRRRGGSGGVDKDKERSRP